MKHLIAGLRLSVLKYEYILKYDAEQLIFTSNYRELHLLTLNFKNNILKHMFPARKHYLFWSIIFQKNGSELPKRQIISK